MGTSISQVSGGGGGVGGGGSTRSGRQQGMTGGCTPLGFMPCHMHSTQKAGGLVGIMSTGPPYRK